MGGEVGAEEPLLLPLPLVGGLSVGGEEEEEEDDDDDEVVEGGGRVGGRVVFPQHGTVKGLKRLSCPPWHTSPAIFL